MDNNSDPPRRHAAVVLFYKYFLTSEFPVLRKHGSYFEEKLLAFQKSLCQRLQLKGRILLSAEGINGTLSATSMQVIDEYIQEMENFELIRDCGLPGASSNNREQANDDDDDDDDGSHEERLFQRVDWKKSCSESSRLPEPFPDLKVSIVKEIISSGGGVKVDEIPQFGGTHLEPHEFHRILGHDPNVVLIDVRNTFECDIGHFVNPNTQQAAMNPEIVKFSMFDDTFCAKQADALKDKKVLMYCTGE